MFNADYIEPLSNGVIVTIQVTLLAATLGTVVAVVSGLAGLSPFRLVRWLNRIYVEVFRGTSAIIQLFWAFFALPLLGVTISPLEAGVYVLGLNMGAYGSEVVRGAVKAVPRGQYEAAIALSLSPLNRMRHVIFPQAIPAMLPPYGNLLIELLKGTALVSLITLSDILFEIQKLRTSGAGTAQELYVIGLVLYFIIALGITGGIRSAERLASRGFEGTR
jgi:polar amino acid transport system permease protein